MVRRQAPQIELYRQLRRTVNIRRDGFKKPRLKAKHQDMHIAGPAKRHRTAGGCETAVAQEVVRLASRSDISEEVARFRAHVAHWVMLSDSAEPCGRKLDFLLQEMNREVNTMGSKADGLRVSELVIAAKAELEKMREQVQNVE